MEHGMPIRFLVLACTVFWLAVHCLAAEDRGPDDRASTRPISEPPTLVLSQDEQAKLAREKVVYQHVDTVEGKRSAVVFRVNAPAAIIWSVITDFDSYPGWVKGVKDVEVYKIENDDIYVRFRIGHCGLGHMKSDTCGKKILPTFLILITN